MPLTIQENQTPNLKQTRDNYNSFVKEFTTCQNHYNSLKTKLLNLKGTILQDTKHHYKIIDILFQPDFNSKKGGISVLKLIICNKNGKISIWRKLLHQYHYTAINSYLNP